MRKLLFLLFSVFTALSVLSCSGDSDMPCVTCGDDVVHGDPVIYGNESYETVVIGTQTWMARNLNYEPSGTNVAQNSKCYDREPVNCAIYGRLYDWATAMALPSDCNPTSCTQRIKTEHQGICPKDWHIPSDADWSELLRYVDGTPNPYYSSTAGKYLKAMSGWNNSDSKGIDSFGFAALSGGYSNSNGSFSSAGDNGRWWSSTEYNATDAFGLHMSFSYNYVFQNLYGKGNFHSIRCLKN